MAARATAFRYAFIVALVTSVTNYLVSQFFPWQLNKVGAAEILLLCGVCIVVGLDLLFRMLPETRNRTIEEIEIAMKGFRGVAA